MNPEARGRVTKRSLQRGRIKALELVAEAARELARHYEKCSQYPENVTIAPRYLTVLQTELIDLDAYEESLS